MTTVHLEAIAQDRLAQLGLTSSSLHRALLRADAEVALVTALEPPNAEGITRYNKTTRFVREELLPLGWNHSNSSNFCRTISPDGSFALVASSGDGGAGMYLPGQSPSTRYPKGETTVRAVARNQQLALDLGTDFDDPAESDAVTMVWYLLYQVTKETIYCELSLPAAIDNGFINSWLERIILPPVDRPGVTAMNLGNDDGGSGVDYEVPVTRRA